MFKIDVYEYFNGILHVYKCFEAPSYIFKMMPQILLKGAQRHVPKLRGVVTSVYTKQALHTSK